MTTERPPERTPTLLARLYVPLATAALVLGLGDLLAIETPRPDAPSAAERTHAIEACTRTETPRWIYLGHSQTSVIPDRQPDDHPAPEVLDQLLHRPPAPTSAPSICSLSLGGMNVAEAFALLASTAEHHRPSVRGVITSVALDQMRSLSLREEVAAELAQPEIQAKVRAFVAAQADLPDAQRALDPFLQPKASGTPEQASSRTAEAERVEAALQETSEHLPLFSRREDMQRALVTAYVGARNRGLGISSASTRVVAETTYHASLQLLELGLRYADAQHFPLVVYVGPFRKRTPRPFTEDALAGLRKDALALCARYHATCFDYLDLLPDEVYSVYPPGSEGLDGQPDFAHLKGPGHRALAERLARDLGPLLAPPGGAP